MIPAQDRYQSGVWYDSQMLYCFTLEKGTSTCLQVSLNAYVMQVRQYYVSEDKHKCLWKAFITHIVGF